MPRMTINNDECYSAMEIEDLLSTLKEVVIVRVCRTYTLSGCEALSGFSAKDIFGMVTVETLNGTRNWPRSVGLETYYRQQGRSIIDRERKKYQRHSLVQSHDELPLGDDMPSSALAKFSHAPAESGIEQQQANNLVKTWTTKVLELFSDDSDALCYLNQLIEDNTKKSAIQKICQLSEALYNNVRKRIKDKVKKRFPNGIAWWEIEQ